MIVKIDWNILNHVELKRFHNKGALTSNCELYYLENNNKLEAKDFFNVSSSMVADGFIGEVILSRCLDHDSRFPDIINSNEFYKALLKHIESVDSFTGTIGLELLDVGVADDYFMDLDNNYFRSYKFIKLIGE
jgi:hypothetical protein